jgi:hypothetical protein
MVDGGLTHCALGHVMDALKRSLHGWVQAWSGIAGADTLPNVGRNTTLK